MEQRQAHKYRIAGSSGALRGGPNTWAVGLYPDYSASTRNSVP